MHTKRGLKNQASAISRFKTLTDTHASSVIGPDGGEIHLTGAGLRISFPKGALEESTTISVSASESSYGFTVTGAPRLLKRARVEQEIEPGHDHTIENLVFGHIVEDGLVDVYYAARNEGGKAVAHIDSFSGYLLASGAQEGMPCDPTVVTDGTCVWVDDGSPESPR